LPGLADRGRPWRRCSTPADAPVDAILDGDRISAAVTELFEARQAWTELPHRRVTHPRLATGEGSHVSTSTPSTAGPSPSGPRPWRPIEPPTIVVDDTFALDRWRATDSDALRQFDLDPQAARFFGWTVEQARALPDSHYDGPERERASLHAWHEGKRLNMAIRRRGDGQAVGWVELRPSSDPANVSYMVAASLRRQGIATRSLQALLTWAASEVGLQHARLVCHVDNHASRRVADKCGFVLVGRHGDEYQFELSLRASGRG
jgi:RimJ/RimL family protein N-acetyltransferase